MLNKVTDMIKSKKKDYKILVINPGSTSTKIAVFQNEKNVFQKNIEHSSGKLDKFPKMWDQYPFRKEIILQELKDNNIDVDTFDCIVGRGGLINPIPSGTYEVDQRMIEDARAAIRGEHASNLGAILAYSIATELDIPSFIVDPPAVDEMEPIARISGTSEIPRESLFHALNIKAVARLAAKKLNKKLDNCNLILVHLGGGISVCALKKGKIADLYNALTEGPFTPERAGTIPTIPLVKLCFSGKYTQKEITKMLVGKGGLVSYLGTNNAATAEEMVEDGNQHARLIYEAMAYQISKCIGAMAVVLEGKVDQIVITGGIARSDMLIDWIREKTKFIAKITTFPGEHEMEALALGGLRILKGEEETKKYTRKKYKIGLLYWKPINEYEMAISELEKILTKSGYKLDTGEADIEFLDKNCHSSEHQLENNLKSLIDEKVNLIYAVGTTIMPKLMQVLKDKNIPVVNVATFDPVIMGIIDSYDKPDSYITGSYYRVDMAEQIKEGLLKLLPNIKRIGFLYNKGEIHPEIQLEEARKFCKKKGIELFDYIANTEEDLSNSVSYFKEKQVDAIIMPADTNITTARRKTILKISNQFPTLCSAKSAVLKGGLVSYTNNYKSVCTMGAKTALRVLDGTLPSEIPFVSPKSKYLIINNKTAMLFDINTKHIQPTGLVEIIK
ncbi:MAG: butyrate kinase [Armatimonadota bacterium]